MINGAQRKVWADVLKGIALTFVVIAHHPFLNQKNFYFTFFDIPLFFFISGYFFNQNTSLKILLQKRFNSLIKPYLFTVIFISLSYILFKDGPSFFWYFFWVIYGNGPNLPKAAIHLWFLPNLFLSTVFVWLLFKYIRLLKNSFIIQCLLICFLFICGYVVIHSFWDIKINLSFRDDINLFFIKSLFQNPYYSETELSQLVSNNQFLMKGLPWTSDSIFLSAAFFLTGYSVKIKKMDNVFNNSLLALIMISVFFIFQYFFNYTMNFSDRRYDHLLISVISVFAAIYVCVYFSHIIAKWDNIITKIFTIIGKYSLVIFLFHPTIQSKIFYLGTSIFPHAKYFVSVVAFIVGICLPLLINNCLLEKFRFFRYWYYSK